MTVNLVGKSFYYDSCKFTVTRDWYKAIRVSINDTKQAIWIPRACIEIVNNEIRPKDINWIFCKPQTIHKIKLAKEQVL